jgi:hypothetical protein
MRLLLIGSAVAWIGLAVSLAATDQAYAKKYRSTYSSCFCHFGYPERECVPVVSCYAEGGRCTSACPRQP